MKTYGWQTPEQLKFINENPKVLSLLYDLSILPEEISARVRGIVEEELKESNRLIEAQQKSLDAVYKEHAVSVEALVNAQAALRHELFGNEPCAENCEPGGWAKCTGCDARAKAAVRLADLKRKCSCSNWETVGESRFELKCLKCGGYAP